MLANQSLAAQMSVRAALTALILSVLMSLSPIVPERPEGVQWLALFWLSVYASMMIAQAVWFGWRRLAARVR